MLHCHKLTDTRTSCALLTRLMQVFQIVLYIVWAGSSHLQMLCAGRVTYTSHVAFAGLRVYAISARNFVVTVVVVVLAVVPAVTNAVGAW